MAEERKSSYAFTRTPMDLRLFLDLVHARHSEFQKNFTKKSAEEMESPRKRKRDNMQKRKIDLENRLEECRKKKEKLTQEAAALLQEKESKSEEKHRLLLQLKEHLAMENKKSKTLVNGIRPKKRIREADDNHGDSPNDDFKGKLQKHCPPKTPSTPSPPVLGPLSNGSSSKLCDRNTLPPHLALVGSCSTTFTSVQGLPPHLKNSEEEVNPGDKFSEMKGNEQNHKLHKTANILYKR